MSSLDTDFYGNSMPWYGQINTDSDSYGECVRAWVKAEVTSVSGRTANVTITGAYDYSGSYIYSNDNPWVFTIICPWGNKDTSATYVSNEVWFSSSGTLNYDDNGDLTIQFGIHIDGGWLGSKWSPWVYLHASNIGKKNAPVDAPTNVNAKLNSDGASIALTWSHVGGTSYKPLSGFWIDPAEDDKGFVSGSINTNNDNSSQRSITLNASTKNSTSLPNGIAINKKYQFKVYAHGDGGSNSANSNIVYTKPTAITSYSNFTAKFLGSLSKIKISFDYDISNIAWPGKMTCTFCNNEITVIDNVKNKKGTAEVLLNNVPNIITALQSTYNDMYITESRTVAPFYTTLKVYNLDGTAYSSASCGVTTLIKYASTPLWLNISDNKSLKDIYVNIPSGKSLKGIYINV